MQFIALFTLNIDRTMILYVLFIYANMQQNSLSKLQDLTMTHDRQLLLILNMQVIALCTLNIGHFEHATVQYLVPHFGSSFCTRVKNLALCSAIFQKCPSSHYMWPADHRYTTLITNSAFFLWSTGRQS